MRIEGRIIDQHRRPYVVAELSCNHNGSLDRAKAIIHAAAQAGADAIKFQTFCPARIANSRGGPDKMLPSGPWAGRRLGELYAEAWTPNEWLPDLIDTASDAEITWFSSVFDPLDVQLLEALDCPAYKVSSFEAGNGPLLDAIAKTGKPMIVSTGMASDEEIGRAIWHSIDGGGMNNIAILHCVSAYPTMPEDANLGRMGTLRRKFGGPVGFSDHTQGIAVAIAAAARGAEIIEKHVCLSRDDGGLDALFSIEPEELDALVAGVTDAFLACDNVASAGEIYRDLKVTA